jgi:hypothetical protein
MFPSVEFIRTYLLNLRDEFEAEALRCRTYRRDQGAPMRAHEFDKQRHVVERILRELKL